MIYRDRATTRPRLAWVSGIALSVLVTALSLTGCSSSSPTALETFDTYVVDPAGGGDFLTIQEGLNAASDGDTVFVVPGTYTGPGNRNLLFNGVSCTLIGGASRDETVIDCEGAGRGFYIAGASPIIENLAVVNGDTVRGGGMYLEGASPFLSNVRFRDNRATDGGGGLYCRNGSPVLVDVLFDDNSAAISGGGMLCVNDSAPALTDVVFFRNAAAGSGGGLACLFSSPVVTGTVFHRNSAGLGGGVYCGSASPTIIHCTFAENEAAEGGGICCRDASAPAVSRTIIAFGRSGGALSCEEGSDPSTTLSCIFANEGGDTLCGSYTTSMLYTDPLFCDIGSGDLTLESGSECLPGNNTWGAQIGARGQGCDGLD